MQLGSTNILDQLLGGFETMPSGLTGTTGSQGEGNAAGIMFGELLAGIMGNSQTLVDPNGIQLSSCLFPSSDQPAAQDGAPTGQSSGNQSLIDITSTQSTAIQLLGLLANAGVVTQLPNATGATTSPEASSDNTATATVSGDLMSLVNSTPTTQKAVYNIIDFRVDGGQVELTATTQDTPSETVKISVPVSVMAQALAEKIGTVATQKLNQTTNLTNDMATGLATPNLDKLLQASNLKTLSISQDAGNTTVKAELPVTVALVAEDNSARIAFTAKLNRRDDVLKTKSDLSLDGDVISEDSGHDVKTTSANSSPVTGKVDNLDLLPLRRISVASKTSQLDRFNLGSNDGVTKSDITLTGLNSDPSSNSLSGNSQTTVTTPVKFTLPDTIHKPFAASGQTIMIKIEPDHLGPARLNLSVRDQMLTARVTVDTPAAKMAVERSLGQLTEQLSRAGIDVDRIDVMLDNSGGREQFFDRRPLWSQSRNQRNVTEADASETDTISAISPTLLSSRYVVNRGVDLLA
jgi:flagellar hook-length control protein FliK